MSLGAIVLGDLSLLDLTGITAATARIGGITVPRAGITTSASTIAIGGTGFNAATLTTLDLRATASLSQTAPLLNVNTLTDGTSTIPTIALTNSQNTIAQLGDLRAGSLALTDLNALTTSATVGGGSSTNLTTTNGSLTLAAGALVSGTTNTLTSTNGSIDIQSNATASGATNTLTSTNGSIAVANGATASGTTTSLSASNGGLAIAGTVTGTSTAALSAGANGISQQGTGTLVSTPSAARPPAPPP